jgi:lipopolysaccharide transport system ATP-binding protein
MTGRENIFMNGAILGMTKQEIAAKLDEIIDFSGCEKYIDTPVKRYSSGMTVRLGFAVAAFLDPEILVVDEVLAVGDAEFQKKAIGKMKDVSQGQGRTVLFVSHNMSSIKQLCKTGVVLKNGLFDFMGTADSAVDYYVGKYSQNDCKMFYPDLTIAPGNAKIRIRSMEVVDSKSGNITMDSDIDVKLQFYNYVANSMIDCTFELHTADDTVVFHRWLNFSPNHDSMVGEQSISFQIPKHLLNAGKYYFRIFFGENEAHLMWGDLIYNFEVEFTEEKVGNIIVGNKPGIIRPELNFKHEILG